VSTLLLAAGVGSRLDPLTRVTAKAALPLAGRTLIERALDWLAREGRHDVVINLHHRPAAIAAVVGDGAHLGLRVRYSWEPTILGSAGGPRHALPLLDSETLLIVNAEPLCDFPIAPLVSHHTASGADVTLAVVPNRAPDEFNGLVADERGHVREIVPKGRAQGTWHFIGVQVARSSVFAGLPDGEPAETIPGIYREAIARGSLDIRVHAVETAPIHVGTPQEYLAAALALASRSCCDSTIEPGADVASSARIRRSLIWPGVRIGPEVDLVGCIVAGAAVVPAGVRATNAVVMPESFARTGETVERRQGLALFPLPIAGGQ